MKPRAFLTVLIAVSVGTICYAFLIDPYFALPKEDIAFLATRPSVHELISRFGEPEEKISKGESFQMTGWHPLPSSQALHSGMSFVRRYGSKIYVFLDGDNRVSYYEIAKS
jgi:hypothetical protein